MALVTNYTTLVTAIEDYLARTDLNSWVPNFIQNTQSRLHRDIRIRDFETTLSGTISSGVLAIPADFVELKYAYVNDSPIKPLQKVPPEEIYDTYPVRSGAETPIMISTEGANFIFGPYPADKEIRGIYYAREPLISGANETNWFTANAPDALLYGSMYHAMLFVKDEVRTAHWGELFEQSIASINSEEQRQQRRGSPLRARYR